MTHKFKFKFGDKVYTFGRVTELCSVPCPACGRKGWIKGKDGEQYTCPKCDGGGREKFTQLSEYTPTGPLTIGYVRVIIVDKKHLKEGYSEISEEYMCVETGIHTGRRLLGERLFKTEAAALKECKKRNAEAETK